MKILVLAVTAQAAIQNAEQFYPEPKLGRLSDPEKIKAKIAEHHATCAEAAASSSILGTPTSVDVCLIDVPENSVTFNSATVGQTETFTDPTALANYLNQYDDVQKIIGVHATTHTRQVQNWLLRSGVPVPKALHYYVNRVNPFEYISNKSEAEYPKCLEPLGLAAQGPIEDTIAIARHIGVF